MTIPTEVRERIEGRHYVVFKSGRSIPFNLSDITIIE